jgi:hypothetical protein
MKKSDSQQPKEEMIETFQSIWKHASQAERDYIQKIWSAIMQSAHVLNWKPTSKSNEYQLELKEEVVGSHPDIPLGELVLKDKMDISFSEDKISGTDRYRQIIRFPDNGVAVRIGMGWLSKENPLQHIIIEENQQGEIWCTVEVFGQSIVRLAEEALAFWNKASWHT